MTSALDAPRLGWGDWLTLRNVEIRAAGANPADRWLHVGAKWSFTANWAGTVGMWGVAGPKEIMARAGVSRAAYDVFCSRHQLWSGPHLAKIKAIGPHDQFALAAAVHACAWRHRDQHGFSSTSHGLGPEEAQTVAVEFHILPVEVMLYFKAVEDVMLDAQLSRFDWDRTSAPVRRNAWVSAWGEEAPIRFRVREQ